MFVGGLADEAAQSPIATARSGQFRRGPRHKSQGMRTSPPRQIGDLSLKPVTDFSTYPRTVWCEFARAIDGAIVLPALRHTKLAERATEPSLLVHRPTSGP